MDGLIELDHKLFFFFNSLHADWLDQIMYWISDKYVWIPFYLFIIGWIIKTYKKQSWIYILGIIITITIADQVASGLMKPFFQRWRPSRDPQFEGLVHIVNDYRGGRYGFASSHAANMFGLATFLYLLFKEYYKWMVWIFLWATIVSYSRIYLGVHYPGDIVVGALLGAVAGWGIFKLSEMLARKLSAQT